MKALSTQLKRFTALTLALAMTVLSVPFSAPALASSHMDAPLITRDPSANTTDVYAFVTEDNGVKYLTVALSVYPHEEPGIGPNKYNFDENVRYEIHLARGNDLTIGYPTLTYRFEFGTDYKNRNTILQSYLGVVQNVGDANQNLTQSYTITRLNNRTGNRLNIGGGLVPPNNQGIATPFYNQSDNGENPAKKGVATESALDKYTQQGIYKFRNGYWAFAGQRDDGFYADVQSIFDLLQLRNPGKDSQGGFNVHMMALRIPMSEIGGDQQTVGVFATTSRAAVNVSRGFGRADRETRSQFVQVARQGNPLFNEGLVAIADKDLYSRTLPTVDRLLFRRYAENPELAALINAIIGKGQQLAIPTGRADIAAIFIPDVIKVDFPPLRCGWRGTAIPQTRTTQDFRAWESSAVMCWKALRRGIRSAYPVRCWEQMLPNSTFPVDGPTVVALGMTLLTSPSSRCCRIYVMGTIRKSVIRLWAITMV